MFGDRNAPKPPERKHLLAHSNGVCMSARRGRAQARGENDNHRAQGFSFVWLGGWRCRLQKLEDEVSSRTTVVERVYTEKKPSQLQPHEYQPIPQRDPGMLCHKTWRTVLSTLNGWQGACFHAAWFLYCTNCPSEESGPHDPTLGPGSDNYHVVVVSQRDTSHVLFDCRMLRKVMPGFPR